MIYDGSHRPGWAYNNYSLISLLINKNNRRLILLENLEHNYDILELIKPDDKVLVLTGCYFDDWNFDFAKKCLAYKNGKIDLRNICYLSNTEEQVILAKKYGFDAILFNHNAWIDTNKFQIIECQKKYNLVMNTRPDNIKRPWLASKVENLAIIKGNAYVSERFFDLDDLNPAYINSSRISSSEVVQILSESWVGGIFSEKEGAAYSSGEYLLCGLPVVSTESKGGREIWYNENNSFIAEADEDSVRDGVLYLIKKIKNGEISPYNIRAMHIEFSELLKANLNQKIFSILDDFNCVEDYEGVKFKLYSEKVSSVRLDLVPSLLG
jgi:glycosyltransferase involved in cell wall biosynthesis